MNQTKQHSTGRAAAILKALAHDLRFRIMITLTDGESTPKELSDQLEAPFKRVCEHVKLLERDGLIEMVGTDVRHGGVQHVFRSTVRPYVDTKDSSTLPLPRREEISAAIIQSIILDFVRATESGSMDTRADRVLVRQPMLLDEMGFKEADDACIEHMEKLDGIKANAFARATVTGGVLINAASATTVFPMPEEGE